jgi:hypothetical protein
MAFEILVRPLVDARKTCTVEDVNAANAAGSDEIPGDSLLVESVDIQNDGIITVRRCGRCALDCILYTYEGETVFAGGPDSQKYIADACPPIEVGAAE